MKKSDTWGFNHTHCFLEFYVEKYLHLWSMAAIGQLLSTHTRAFKYALA